MMKESKSNTMFVVLGLLAVSLILFCCIITKQQLIDIVYLFLIDVCLMRYLYCKKRS